MIMPNSYAAAVVGAIGGQMLGFGVIATRLGGVGDVRQIGSGNIGVINVLRTGRCDLALITVIDNDGKRAVAVLLALWLRGSAAFAAFARGAAFRWHLFPVWLGFNNGKAVATTFGTMIVVAWAAGLAAGATWIVMAAIFRLSSLASLTAAVLGPLYVFHQFEIWGALRGEKS